MAETMLEPEDAATAATLLADASTRGTRLVMRGANTTALKADANVVSLSTRKLTNGLTHFAGDLVATVPAGLTLRELNAALAAERQWLPLDPPHAGDATIGGIVATNASGPLRHRYGAPRDLVIGIEVALTNGRVARAGGRVVKNVAGYDLSRLFCGSHGSLGLITHVTFKLAPVAATSRTVVAHVRSLAQAATLATELGTNASLTPSTVELVAPDTRLLVRYDTTERSGALMASATAALLAPHCTTVAIVDGAAHDGLWAAHQAIESAPTALVSTLSTLPRHIGAALDTVVRLASEHGVAWQATGRVALGVARVLTTGVPDSQRAFALALRAALEAHDGRVQFGGDLTGLDDVDASGVLGATAQVAHAVKQQFDPAGILPYPWGTR